MFMQKTIEYFACLRKTLKLHSYHSSMNSKEKIHVLGGGPAGLAVAYYAKKAGLVFNLYEASDKTGGNAVTLKHGDFLFDSGAHRLHGKNPEVTAECQKMLGSALKKVCVPSQVYHQGELIDFPLSPLNLLKKLGPFTFLKACRQVLSKRIGKNSPILNFEDFAVSAYGQDLAGRFLLGYSKKLWGLPCRELSPSIASSRLKGLTLHTFILEALFGKKAKTEHLEGHDFYYPDYGIGMIAKALEHFCGEESVNTQSRITRLFHNSHSITGVEINGAKRIETSFLINTLPLPLFLQIMDPKPPEPILRISNGLRFRSMILFLLTLDKESCTPNATVYFPDPDCVFTRVYEPRNRSLHMSPPGKTSLVAEIPCQTNDFLWNQPESALKQKVCSQLLQTGWFRPEHILDTHLVKIFHAYPVLELGFEEKVRTLLDYLQRFKNLRMTGRNGKFTYTSIHHMMTFGKELIDELQAQQNVGASTTAAPEPALV